MNTRNVLLCVTLLASSWLTLFASAQTVEYHRQCYAPAGTIRVGHKSLTSHGLKGFIKNAAGRCEYFRDVYSSGTLYWVDVQDGNDANSGTDAAQAFKTIGRALRGTAAGAGDVVVILQGTYFEKVAPQVEGTSGKPLTIMAYPGHEVWVDGRELVTDPDGSGGDGTSWAQDAGRRWHRAWTYDPEDPLNVQVSKDPAYYPDILVVETASGDSMLTQVHSKGDVVPGTFYVERSSSQANPRHIYAMSPDGAGVSLNAKHVWTSTKKALFWPGGVGTANPHCSRHEDQSVRDARRDNFRLLGLKFRYVSNYSIFTPAVCIAGDGGNELYDIEAWHANGSNIKLYGHGITARDVRVYFGGHAGIDGTTCNGCEVDGVISAYNLSQGYNPGNHGGGGKFTRTEDAVFTNLYYHDNDGAGFWFDEKNKRNLVKNSLFVNNLFFGFGIELRGEDNVFVNNVVMGVREVDYPSAGPHGDAYGILTASSTGNLFAFNTIYDAEWGIYLRYDNRSNTTERQKHGRDNHFYNNLILEQGVSGDDRADFRFTFKDPFSNNGIRLNGNAYWRGAGGATDGNSVFWWKTTTARGAPSTSNNLSGWQGATGQDADAYQTDPERPHVRNLFDPLAGWNLAPGSQYVGRATRIPPSSIPDWYEAAYGKHIAYDIYDTPRPAATSDIGAHQYTAASSGNLPPSVRIITPAPGAGFEAGETVTVAASASDVDGSVTRVEFFQGGTKLGEDVMAPYEHVWQNVSAGTHQLTARATDNDGNTTTSVTVLIVVNQPRTPVLLAEYDFLRGADAQRLYDLTGNGFHGTLGRSGGSDANDPTWTPEGLTFDGVDDYVTLGDALDITESDDLTVLLYFKPDVVSGNHALFNKRGTGPAYYFARLQSDGSLRFQGRNTSRVEVFDTEPFAAGAIEAGRYRMLSWRLENGRRLRLGLDGATSADVAFGPTQDFSNRAEFKLGAFTLSAKLYHAFSGILAYARIYNHTLTDTEVAAAYQEISQLVVARTGVRVTHRIPLQQGRNLISSYVNPEETTISALFAEVAPNLELVEGPAGRAYVPALGIDNLDPWDARQAYLVYMNAPDTLVLRGALLDPAVTPLKLQDGWNDVAYLGRTGLSADVAFAGIGGDLEVVKDQDGNLYYPAYGINTLGTLRPGQGYRVYVNQATTLVYPSTTTAAQGRPSSPLSTPDPYENR